MSTNINRPASGHPPDSGDKDPQSVASKSDSQPTPTNKNKSKQKCRTFLEWAKFAVEVLGLFGLFYYASLTRSLLKEAEKTATEANRQNELGQLTARLQSRPFVGILDVSQVLVTTSRKAKTG
jgi:hypothetical protein